MTDVQLLRSDLISSDEGRVFGALTLLRESVKAVLTQTEQHPLDSLFAKYYAASPEFSEVIVAWDSQSSKETKISLLCVHVLIDSFKCSIIIWAACLPISSISSSSSFAKSKYTQSVSFIR